MRARAWRGLYENLAAMASRSALAVARATVTSTSSWLPAARTLRHPAGAAHLYVARAGL